MQLFLHRLKNKNMELINKQELIDSLIKEGRIKQQYGCKYIEPIKPSHGACCCCSDCGQYHDDCVCGHNEWVNFVNSLITYTHERKY